jgi:ribosomal protein L11 methyltransferase
MKWIAAKVFLDQGPVEPFVECISALFENLGLTGVVIEDPDMEPSEGWGEDALPKPEQHSVTGYFTQNDMLAENTRKLEQGLEALKQTEGISVQVQYHEVDEEDWAESWKAYFHPEKITDILVVKPTWREYLPKQGEIIIEIDPGMAFGTGTHPTTALCIQLIQQYLKPEDSFLDVGTGSGILMIAAAKLGASRLLGIDMDPVAVEVAGRNLSLNRVTPEQCEVKIGDLVNVVSDKFRLVCANILSDVILGLLNDIQTVLAPEAVVIFSGITEGNLEKVLDKMKRVGFDMLEVRSKEGWVAIAGKCL